MSAGTRRSSRSTPRPDYHASLLAVDGIVSGPSDEARLREDTETALFILDSSSTHPRLILDSSSTHPRLILDALVILGALGPTSDEALRAAADGLVLHLQERDPDVRASCRLIAAT